MSKNLVIENINTPAMLGVALKRLRKKSGLSQAQVASLVNIRQATISDLENGRGTLESLFKVIQILKVNLTLSDKNVSIEKKGKSKVTKLLDLLDD